MAKQRYLTNYIARIIIPILLLILATVSGLTAYIVMFKELIYPNITVADINVGGKSLDEASLLLSKNVIKPDFLTLVYKQKEYRIKTSDIDLSYDFTATTQKAYQSVRSGSILPDLKNRVLLLFQTEDVDIEIFLNESKLQKIITDISNEISVKPVPPSVKLVNGQVVIEKGSAGNVLDKSSLVIMIRDSFSKGKLVNFEIPMITDDPSLSPDEVDDLKIRAEKFIGKSLQMKFEYSQFSLNDGEIIDLFDPSGGYKQNLIDEVIQKNTLLINRNPQNPKFSFENGKVKEFQPALDGVNVDTNKYKELITSNLNDLSNSSEKTLSFDIPVIRVAPEVTTGEINSFGIKELIGRGTSTYFHSIPGRVYNVSLATSRINGTLIKPGDTFSFNSTLGDVSEFTGYKQAYIISEGKTILGDGGGVCQVSSTLFRALLNAGLPITERQAHAYRVGYYEQGSPPGMDATVYSPSPDLKFKNDTSSYILIQAKADSKRYSLVFELYGTNDGRVATVTKPIVSNITPALPTVYQDDPTLPIGTTKQVDYSAAGARVTFNYSVNRGGETIFKKTFISNYRPWAAVYLRGTAPAN